MNSSYLLLQNKIHGQIHKIYKIRIFIYANQTQPNIFFIRNLSNEQKNKKEYTKRNRLSLTATTYEFKDTEEKNSFIQIKVHG